MVSACAARYTIRAPSIDAGYCHCRLCQRSAGAPVLTWLTVPVGGFTYTLGQPTVFRSSAHGQREFCSRCGTQLAFRRQQDARTVDITIASLDEPSAFTPERHIWRMSRIVCSRCATPCRVSRMRVPTGAISARGLELRCYMILRYPAC